MKKKILIFGKNSFIGSSLYTYLKNKHGNDLEIPENPTFNDVIAEANKISEINLNEIILLLDKFDKSIKGVLNYDSWQIAKDVVMRFCRASKKITT